MPDFSLSLGYFFTDVPVAARFSRARAAGFSAVEMFWPGSQSPAELAAARSAAGTDVVLFNMNEGNYARGDRGFACRPERRPWWREQLAAALDLASALGCPRINVLPGKTDPGARRASYLECFAENLCWAAPQAAERGVSLLIEPLNHLTHPDQLCRRTTDVLEVIRLVGCDNVRLQYDVYHAQRSEGNIIDTLREHMDVIGHIQIADVPTRSAPGTGELNFAAILNEIDALRYPGYVGLEYQPPAPPTDPFGWMSQHEPA